MCDNPIKLIAWLDSELSASDAAEVERHLQTCAECRNQVERYERLTCALDTYCDAAMTAKPPHAAARRKSVLLGAGTVAAVVILLLVFARVHETRRNTSFPLAEAPAVATAAAAPSAAKRMHPRHVPAPRQIQESKYLVADPAIQITIPSDAVLPPGAVPYGVNLVADVRISPDGSVQQIFVWP